MASTIPTKAGRACRGTPLTDKSYCIAHAPKEAKVARGFGGAQVGSGPKRAKRPHEVAQQVLEEYIDVVLAPRFKALGYSIVMDHESGRARLEALEDGGAKVLGESKDGVVKGSRFKDLASQIAAAEKLLDRVYGRPKRSTEVEVTERTAVSFLDDPEMVQPHRVMLRAAARAQRN
jgi:hypothetical protein